MALISVTEQIASGGGTISISDRTYRRHFLVDYDAITDAGINDVVTANDGTTAIPAYYAHYVTIAGAVDYSSVLVSKTAERDDTRPELWHVYCDYQFWAGADGSAGVLTIENKPDIVRAWPELYERWMEKDLDGKVYQSSAEELFDPQSIVFTQMVIEVTRNVRTLNTLLWAYQNSTNTDVIYNVPAFFILCRSINPGTRLFDSVGSYYEQRMEFLIRDPNDGDPFHPVQHLDKGFFRLAAADGGEPSPSDPAVGQARIGLQDGTFPQKPVLLDGQGQPLAKGQPPHYIDFREVKLLPFAALNLPSLNVVF